MGFKGGCTCRAITYKVDAEPLMNVLCHCTNCQKTSGSAFSINLVVPKAALKVSGTPRTFLDVGDSGGKVLRSFCGTCGASLFSDLNFDENLYTIKGGSVDEPGKVVAPVKQIFCSSKQGWFEPASFAGVEAFERGL